MVPTCQILLDSDARIPTFDLPACTRAGAVAIPSAGAVSAGGLVEGKTFPID